MHIAILRRAPGVSFSMDVYADGLIKGLKTVRPNWHIHEISPRPWWNDGESANWQAGSGLKKYYERFWNHPKAALAADVDLFHIIDHSNGHLAYWLSKTGKSVITTCHDLVQLVYPEILRDQSRLPAISLAIWKYSANGLRQSNHIISVSSNTAQDISKFLDVDPKNISVIPNAVDSSFKELPTSDLETKTVHSPIRLLNVGSTHHRKNILTVLRVLKNLQKKGKKAVLWRVGGDFTQEQTEFIQTQQLQNSIIDFGKPNQQELIKIYNSADYLIAPSLYEGFGLTILEAMACGLPVITSTTSSLPEVVGDAGILVDPNNVSSIVEHIVRLSKASEQRNSFIKKGLSRVRRFTWEKTAEQVAQVYEMQLKEIQHGKITC